MMTSTEASRLATNDTAADSTMPCTATRVDSARANRQIKMNTRAWTPCGAPDTRSSRYPVHSATIEADEMAHLLDTPTYSTTSSPRLGAAIRTGASSSTVDCSTSRMYATSNVRSERIVKTSPKRGRGSQASPGGPRHVPHRYTEGP